MLLSSNTTSDTFKLPTIVVAISDTRDNHLLFWLSQTNFEFGEDGCHVKILHVNKQGHNDTIEVPLNTPQFIWSLHLCHPNSKGIGNTIKHFCNKHRAKALVCRKTTSSLITYLAKSNTCPLFLIEDQDMGTYNRILLPVVPSLACQEATKWLDEQKIPLFLLHGVCSKTERSKVLTKLAKFSKKLPIILMSQEPALVRAILRGYTLSHSGKNLNCIVPTKGRISQKFGGRTLRETLTLANSLFIYKT